MITVGMNYVVRIGKEEIFVSAFRNVIEVMNAMEGHRETKLYHEVDNPRSFLIVSDWETREAFNAFIRSEKFRRVVNWGREQILEGPPKHEIYEKGGARTGTETAER